jgi:hypothetical protein
MDMSTDVLDYQYEADADGGYDGDDDDSVDVEAVMSVLLEAAVKAGVKGYLIRTPVVGVAM